MSFFAVTVERIATISAHTNADLLEMATLAGRDYEFVVLKGQFQPGDTVIYFPIDSQLPEIIATALGLGGKLAHGSPGADGVRPQNRIKTVKLRGRISQGVVCTPQTVIQAFAPDTVFEQGMDVTAALGVTKYEPPVIPSNTGNLVHLPDGVSLYDIESAQNYIDVIETLMDAPVFITEKIEGSHWSVSLDAEGNFSVNQRNYQIEPIEGKEHDWHKVAREGDYKTKLEGIRADFEADGTVVKRVTLRGELIGSGVQGNYYKLNGHKALVFEIEVNHVPVNPSVFEALWMKFDLETVPVLVADVPLRQWLNGQTLKEASTEKSLLNNNLLREGVVIRPMVETRMPNEERLILKQRSPEYLVKSDS